MKRTINRLLLILLSLLGVSSCTKYEPDMYGCPPTDYQDTMVTDTTSLDSPNSTNINNENK